MILIIFVGIATIMIFYDLNDYKVPEDALTDISVA